MAVNVWTFPYCSGPALLAAIQTSPHILMSQLLAAIPHSSLPLRHRSWTAP